MATSEADVAAKLIERLLMDPAFRVRFRRNPAEACREAGLEELAQEMSIGGGKAMMTLDMRESKSSLAGVMMAAAMEGVGVMQFVEHVAPHLDDIPEAIGDVLSRVNLPAIGGALAPSPPPSAPAAPGGAGANGADTASGGVDPGVDPAVAGNGAAPAAAPAAPVAAGEPVAAGAPEAAAATEGKAGSPVAAAPEKAEPKTAGEQAAEKIAQAEDPKTKTAEAGQKAAADIAENAKDLPSATDLPDGKSAPQAAVDVGGEPKAAGEPAAAAAPAAPVAPAVAPAAPDPNAVPAAAPPADQLADAPAGAKRGAIDPTHFGQTGRGGSLSPEAAALLKNKNLEFDSDGIADLKAGKIDPRVVAALTKLSSEHKLKISCMCSDHSKFTAGGSISNHAMGRGLDIASVDGEIVNPGSAASRELASELSQLPEEYRPDEIGSPWPISGPGYFTDAGHQDHLHLGFKQEIDKSWTPPADVAAQGGTAPAAPAAPGAPAVAAGAPVAAAPGVPVAAAAAVAPPEPKPGESGAFLAAKADASGEKAASGAFMAVKPVGPASALAPPGTVPAAVDAVAAAAPGSGSSSLGAAALKTAETQLGVKEEGTNTGAKVDEYLKAAGVGPGNPWCASFVTWALGQNGHKMEGGGWAAVQTWVRNAEAGKNDLQIVSADQARPGDIVTYDWGGQEDFGADGHIGFLKSTVQDGKFTALEGNNQDAVMNVPRQTSGANVKFIRIGGDAPPATPPLTPAAPAAVAPDPAAAGGSGAADAAAAAADVAGGGANPYPGDSAPKAEIAAWMGREAEKRGLPKQLPVMAALVESGVKNLNFGDADSVGFFQMRVGIWNKGAYAGYPEKPELQVKWFLDQAEAVKKQRLSRGQSVTDPNQFGEWIADVERPAEQYRSRYGMRLAEANGLLGQASAAPAPAAAAAAAPTPGVPVAAAAAVAPPEPKPGESGAFLAAKADASGEKAASGAFMAVKPVGPASALAPPGTVPAAVDAVAAAAPGSGSSSLGAAALKTAETQLGVKEEGTNTGAKVDEYLKAAGVGPGNPWCASFVTWALGQNGHKMEGGGWAAVQTWVRNAEAGKNDLQIVSADQARPGDIVTYDWGGQEDFGADGHIGFLKSTVQDGKFTALEGNNQDAVMNVPRQTSGANVKFIRIGGDAPPAAGAAVPEAPGGAGVADAAAGAVPAGGPSGYPGDNAGKEALAAWLGKEAEKRGLPKQLPVMASLVESGVKNLNYGDADSVGFFQMRVGIWNKGAYAGFPEKPELQIKWFLDQAEAVKKQRLARGQSVTDPKQFGEWIADIERPAEQYRSRYGMRLAEANGLLERAGSAPPAPAAAAPAAPAAAVVDAAASAGGGGGGGAGPQAMAALKEAQKYTGTAYKWGGSTPQTGFDCSGLVQWAYAKAGIQIPRVTDAQFAASNGSPVERGDLKPGDLIFFGKPGNIYHVAISMGGDKFLHAPKTGDVVKVASLNDSYFSQNFAGGRRFDQGAPVAEAAATAPAAPDAAAAAAAPAIDPKAVAEAQAAVARDAAEVGRTNSGLFMAIKAQEERRHKTVQFMKAIDPNEAKVAGAPAAAAPAAGEPVAAAAAAPPAAVEPPAGATPAAAADAGPPIQLPDDISNDYPGNNASKDEIAKWLAKQADKHGLPPELPVMASLVESGVKNLNFGDADSVGFFQMRVGIWDQGAYKGFPEHPELQAKWFIDQALAVKKQAIARGDADFGKDPSKWGEWIADIERPAEQYRGRYQLRLREARGLLG